MKKSININEKPIRDEIFSQERLNQYASFLSENLLISKNPSKEKLLSRVTENYQLFLDTYEEFSQELNHGKEIPPAGMWIIDNHFVIEELFLKIKHDLPPKYYSELPKIENEDSKGLPRVYLLALTLVAHLDSHLDLRTITSFFTTFQERVSLTSGEIWAIPITLRIALLENLRRILVQIVYKQSIRTQTKALAEKIILGKFTEKEIHSKFSAIADNSEFSGSICISQLYKQLREFSPESASLHLIVQNYLEKNNLTIDELINQDHFQDALSQVTLGNIVTSMRLISSVDWQDFFESVSIVEKILGEDPRGVYKTMDFATRDLYRHVIENISKNTGTPETDIASYVLAGAHSAYTQNPEETIHSHVGYYLLDDGLTGVQKHFQYSPGLRERVTTAIKSHPNIYYFSSFLLLQILLMNFILMFEKDHDLALLFYTIAFIPISDTSLNILNFLTHQTLSPRLLPKLKIGNDIPEDGKSFIVVPTIINRPEDVQKRIETLEVHYYSGKDFGKAPGFYYALLSDFADSNNEFEENDSEILSLMENQIQALNEKYSPQSPRFFFFHRPRKWNSGEERWMGWERKRGKIEEFNRFLKDPTFNPFLKIHSESWDRKSFTSINYVITLDSDTVMPIDSAKKLLGTALHPLNKPVVLNNKLNRGYVILQPRISIKPTSACRTFFSKIYSGNTGIDPYTTAVSNVYQDLYGSGIFVGKGLYAVQEFSQLTENKVPENRILSHDLFEGLMTRTALITDIEFMDDYPCNYESYYKRLHRWIRGDWQIAKYLFPVQNIYFTFADKWKILDNLRRSLLPCFFLLWLLSVFAFSKAPLLSVLMLLLSTILPLALNITEQHFKNLKKMSFSLNLKNIIDQLKYGFVQKLLFILYLPHQAYLSLDAIARTIFRLLVSKKHLLEWTTAEETEAKASERSTFQEKLSIAATIFFTIGALVISAQLTNILAAIPFVICWLLLINVSRKINQQIDAPVTLKTEEKEILHLISRRTWHFFETFVCATDNWLPPDNFQENPRPIVAHRTSPTNIGAMLLSTASAYDLGYLGSVELIERIEKTQMSLARLDRFKGHFYNWYDTVSLQPLHPIYISTVDSGNLAAFLFTMSTFCKKLKSEPLFGKQIIAGLNSTFLILKEESSKIDHRFFKSTFHSRTKDHKNEFLHHLDNLIDYNSKSAPIQMLDWNRYVGEVRAQIIHLNDILHSVILEHGEKHFHQLPHWMNCAVKNVESLNNQMDQFLPVSLSWLFKFVEEGLNLHPDKASVLKEFAAEVSFSLDRIQIPNDILKCINELKTRLVEFRIVPTISRTPYFLKKIEEFNAGLERAEQFTLDYISRINYLEKSYLSMSMEMDFKFLYNCERKIFSIGYNLSDGRMDNSFYDLLASEARLASFFSIAKGEIPLEHWFHLGRQMSSIKGRRALISWTASMFEYLMPLLVMKNVKETLLSRTYSAIVETQQEYTRDNEIPWGVSEAAYNARDLNQNYQYGPFGIPGLGLKYGLGADMVISPYSTGLACMVAPLESIENFFKLMKERAFGSFGFYESIDFTTARLPKGKRSHVIKSFMVHHQGMILISLNNVLNDNIMQTRFHFDPMIKAAELLLQEKVPAYTTIIPQFERDTPVKSSLRPQPKNDYRYFGNVETYFPQCNILSNGSYSVMSTTTGAGHSFYKDLSISRWNEDTALDSKGSYIYLQDHSEDRVSSVTYQPMKDKNALYTCHFYEHKTEYIRKTPTLNVQTEIIVSAEDNIEIRRVTLTNLSNETKHIELTSYMEPVFTRAKDDAAHLTFSKLFLETEYIPSRNALLLKRKKRFHEDKERWGVHSVTSDAKEFAETEYETDRLRFLGRNHGPCDPMVITDHLSLSKTTGTVLDPVLSLRKSITVEARSTVHVSFTTGYAQSKDDALRLIDQYYDINAFEREQELSWTQNQVKLRHINVSNEEAMLFQELSSALFFSNPLMRPHSDKMIKPKKSQEGLWAFGISGDIPMVTVRVHTERDFQLVRLMVKAHEYFRTKNLFFDLVLLNEENTTYRTTIHDEMIRLIHSTGMSEKLTKPAGIFVLNTVQLVEEEKNLFISYSKIFLDSNKGSLSEQLERLRLKNAHYNLFEKNYLKVSSEKNYQQKELNIPKLLFFNGLGGFTENGDEYQIFLRKGINTPAPWINVVANSRNFGFTVSETGSGFTWANNSRENRLTPWSNDPVSDPSGEALYIRDEESFNYWSPLPWPADFSAPYLTSHGQGYSRFQHNDHGLNHDCIMYVSLDENVKFIKLNVKNVSPYQRKLSCTFFAEWVLGFNRTQTSQFVITEQEENMIFARNPFNNDYPLDTAFCAINGDEISFTCDRTEFLGRNAGHAAPAGMLKKVLGKKTGAGLDPCGTLRTYFILEPAEERDVLILLGQTRTKEEAKKIVASHLNTTAAENVLNNVKKFWSSLTQAIQIKTPSPELDVLVNKWSLYQTLSCRIWGRSALYQSGGAYGFRDQLQDSLGLLYSKPDIARTQILRSASQQFPEGDVQHWWHPPTNKGVRTKFSDDLLWLPYVVLKYIDRTQDWSILDEETTFIDGPLLKEGQEDIYITPKISAEKASVYEHCVRAMNRSMKTGAHGLPLMGAGDWNDGMNNVGLQGKGESVWVAWFLSKILVDFSAVSLKRGDSVNAEKFQAHSKKVTEAIEQNAWDGNWYKRAFFDDGTPLGSKENDECRIDSLTQSWSVLTELGNKERSVESMKSVYEHLVLKKERVCLLFTPPFEKGKLNPGYIKGYPPGIRENGGQYSHAAAWSSMAFALLKEPEKAYEVLSFLNPITRTKSYSGLQLYKLEPYVIAADIYGGNVHTGRGGWSWYTGSSSLFYQSALEYILGMKIIEGKLILQPCVPPDWKEFSVDLKWKTSTFSILVFLNGSQAEKAGQIELDGIPQTGDAMTLPDDGKSHQIIYRI